MSTLTLFITLISASVMGVVFSLWVRSIKQTHRKQLISISSATQRLGKTSAVLKTANNATLMLKIDNDLTFIEENLKKMNSIKEFKNDFFSNMFHDLRTPINHIQGSMYTLLEGGVDDMAIRNQHLQSALKNAQSLWYTVQDLEFISRIDTDTLTIHPKKFNILDLVRDVLTMMEFSINIYGCKTTIENNCVGRTFVYADEKKIEHVLLNLLSNALRYNQAKKQTIRVVLNDRGGKHISVSVKDNGDGIAKKEQARIFNRFYRTQKARNTSKGGTGLGLSIVKYILESHGENIFLKSGPKIGTTFYFYLPVSKK